MPEKCAISPEDDCNLDMEIALLKKRVEDLEYGQKKESDFRTAYYEERNRRIDYDARMDAKITEMDEKLDKVVAYQESQQTKPIRRFDGFMDKLIWTITAAIIAFLLTQVGLS